MTQEEQQYFEAMEALFQSIGWQLLEADIRGWMESISGQWETIKPEDLRFIQGRYDGLKQVAGLPVLIEGLKDAQAASLEDDT